MGMFDDLICEVPLPDGFVSDRGFQTKSFECSMVTYAIRADGRLERRGGFRWDGDPDGWRPVKFHGVVNFYDYDREGLAPMAPHDEARWHEYNAKFTDGKLVEITPMERCGTTKTAEPSPPESASRVQPGGGTEQ